MIEINATFLYQIAGFFVLYLVLNAFLYKPVVKVLDERDKNTAGMKKEAEALEIELQKRVKDYENRLNEAKAKAHEERLRTREEGLVREREIFEAARSDAHDSLLKEKAKLEHDVKTVMAKLKDESKTISRDIAEKIIGRKVA